MAFSDRFAQCLRHCFASATGARRVGEAEKKVGESYTFRKHSHPDIMRDLLLLAAASTSLLLCQGFVAPSLAGRALHPNQLTLNSKEFAFTTSLEAKKRRRRDGDSEARDDNSSEASGDFPDFDMEEGEIAENAPKPKRNAAPPSEPDEITPAMMSRSSGPTKSVKDLLADRSLESKLEFDDDEEEEDSLPDLIEMARSNAYGGEAAIGKKKARQAQRRAAAIAAKEAENEESFFSNLPFVSDEEGKVQPLKLLEAGAWTGIFLLIAWEVYLNSPLFDRAGPMAPVVF